MYIPHFKKDHRNIPILSKDNINTISERYVVEFMPEILNCPQPLDIERFIESYLDLQLDYQYLSHDGRYLGMTVFNNTDKVVIYLPEVKQADYLHADQGTIIVDNSLLEINQEHCYRFTLGHESGHWVFHKSHFDYDPNQMTLFEINSPYLQCRSINQNYLNEKNGDGMKRDGWSGKLINFQPAY